MKMAGRFKRGTLLTDSTIVIATSFLINILNYLFQLYVGRSLGPIEYGVFGSLVSILYIISVPSTTIRTTITKFVSEFKADGQDEQIAALIFGAIKKLSLYSFFILLVFSMGSGGVASFLKISSRTPAILLGLILVTSFVLPVVMGALLGMQRFWVFGANGVLGALFKLFFGVVLISFGFGVNGALSSLILSNLLVFFVGIISLKTVFQRRGCAVEAIKKRDIYYYSAPVLLTMLSLTVISNIDIVLMKHFLPPEEAGYYAAASLLGKVIFFAAGPISLAMFPKASEEYALKRRSALLLRDSLFYTFVISLFGVTVYFVSPFFVVSSLFGSEFLAVVPLIGLFGVAMALYSLSNVIVMFNMATGNMKFLPFLAFATLLEVSMINWFHSDSITVIKIITLIMASLFAMLLLINKEELMGSSGN